MRKDFDDVVRVGNVRSRWYDRSRKKHRDGNLPLEDVPRKTPDRKTHRYPKIKNGPIRRYLQKQVGRKWSEVWSEICAANDIRANPKPAIFESVEHLVELNPTWDEDGTIWHADRKYREILYPSFYVDPDTGILCQPKPVSRKRRFEDPPKDYVVLDDYHRYYRIKGIWYLVEFREWDETIDFGRSDILLRLRDNDPARPGRRHHRASDAENRYGATIYAVGRQQVDKRTVRWIEERLAAESG